MTDERRKFLHLDITIEKIKRVIKALPSSNAPVPDSFTGEVFKSFATELASPLLEVYKELLERGVLPPTLRQALIIS